jgi:hypothetical protein
MSASQQWPCTWLLEWRRTPRIAGIEKKGGKPKPIRDSEQAGPAGI